MKSTRPRKPKVAAVSRAPRLYTASYTNLNRKPDGERVRYAPVRTTRGAPRFPLRYSLAGVASSIAPPYWLKDLPREEFESKYTDWLDELGIERVESELRAIEKEDGGRPMALLCFCNLETVDYCHRRVFAAWYERATGVEVPELA